MFILYFQEFGNIKSTNQHFIEFRENKNMSDKYSQIDIYEKENQDTFFYEKKTKMLYR